MTLQPWLVERLACPCDQHAPLSYDPDAGDGDGELDCTACDRVFDIVDGIPAMRPDDARRRGSG